MRRQDDRKARLLELIREAGSAAELARRAGVNPAYISQIVTGTKLPSGKARNVGDEMAQKLERGMGKPVGWMDTTTGTLNALLGEFGLTAHGAVGVPAVQSGQISVPLFNATGSMGPGLPIPDADIILDRLSLSADWVRDTLPKITSARNLMFITGKGPSMEPTFADGDILLVDTGIKNVVIDAIYVLSGHGRLFIKRVRQRIDGSYEISSDNPSVKTVDTLNGDHQITVHGRVVWAWNGKRL